MRIAAVSDLHSFLPKIPECDILLIPGDLTWHNTVIGARNWLVSKFSDWLIDISVPVIAVAGNHDAIFTPEFSHLTPVLPDNFTYLQDSTVDFNGLTIFGSPWTKMFNNWSFMKDENVLEDYFNRIIPPADIYVMHSPPRGFGDYSTYSNEHTGSEVLLWKIEVNHPLLAVWGHIHSGHSQHKIGDTVACNVSLVNEEYQPIYPVTVFDYIDGKIQDVVD